MNANAGDIKPHDYSMSDLISILNELTEIAEFYEPGAIRAANSAMVLALMLKTVAKSNIPNGALGLFSVDPYSLAELASEMELLATAVINQKTSAVGQSEFLAPIIKGRGKGSRGFEESMVMARSILAIEYLNKGGETKTKGRQIVGDVLSTRGWVNSHDPAGYLENFERKDFLRPSWSYYREKEIPDIRSYYEREHELRRGEPEDYKDAAHHLLNQIPKKGD